MARSNPIFICSACSGETLKWQGQCPLCGEWNTLEARSAPRSRPPLTAPSAGAVPRPLAAAATGGLERLATGQQELDRVFGGGIVPGSVTLLGGDPGIGKSTLLLQVAAHAALAGTVLYASGEESVDQIDLRARRLGVAANESLRVVAESDLETILGL